MSWCKLCVTFDIGSARMFSTATFETNLLYHKPVWIAANDYSMYFYQKVLSPLTATLKFINRSIDKIYSFITLNLQINLSIKLCCFGAL